MKRVSFALAVCALLFSTQASASSCGANKLCVPGDFPSPGGADFNMDLLGGNVYIDFPGTESGLVGPGFNLVNLQTITFHASPFSGASGASVGTSTLTYSNIGYYSLGSFSLFGSNAEFYLQGTGTGNLVDIDGTKGDWSLNIPLFATWVGTDFNFGLVQLSSANTYSYYNGDAVQTLSGQSMDYASGDVFLVAQASVTDTSNPFYGARITFGLNGNDPVIAVPEASVFGQLLAGLGLLGLVTLIRNRTS